MCSSDLDAEKKKKKAKAKPKRLYAPWLEAVTDCLRQGVTHAADSLFDRESPWSDLTLQGLSRNIEDFGQRIVGHLNEESSSLDRRRALQKASRENLYRLLSTIEEKLKNFKDQDLMSEPLEALRKQVDRLLVQISTP